MVAEQRLVLVCFPSCRDSEGSGHSELSSASTELANMSGDATFGQMEGLVEAAVAERRARGSEVVPHRRRKPRFDYLVVGVGFAGSMMAERLAASGRQVLVCDRRPHVGGNAFDHRDASGILVPPHLSTGMSSMTTARRAMIEAPRTAPRSRPSRVKPSTPSSGCSASAASPRMTGRCCPTRTRAAASGASAADASEGPRLSPNPSGTPSAPASCATPDRPGLACACGPRRSPSPPRPSPTTGSRSRGRSGARCTRVGQPAPSAAGSPSSWPPGSRRASSASASSSHRRPLRT
jgi:hypothetical protein